MISTSIAIGQLTVIAGAAVIAHSMASARRGAQAGAEGRDATSRLLGVLDEQRLTTTLGLALIVFGTLLALVVSSGFTPGPTAVIVLAFLVSIFLFAHVRYAADLRASRGKRVEALRDAACP